MIDPCLLFDEFRTRYGATPRCFQAPGRVNLLGEHTDYNGGFVLPLAIPFGTTVLAAPRMDRTVRAYSRNLGEEIIFSLDRPNPPLRGTWSDYLEGMAQSLVKRGVLLKGADLLLESDVPVGAGLSSSAALEMAVGLALISLADASLSPLDLALAGQAAEHEWVGTRCGIMDQAISATGKAGHALLLDCRSLETRQVPLRLPGASLVLCDSRVKHSLASSAYNERRKECEQGARMLGVASLRELDRLDQKEHLESLPAPIKQRVRHVVGENARTLAACSALEGGRLEEMGRLMFESHSSLRDDYEVSCRELDRLVEIAEGIEGVFGARMTGGGFGGCTINLVRTDALERFERTIRERYRAEFGIEPGIYRVSASDGARESRD